MKRKFLTLAALAVTSVSVFGQTKNVLVDTNSKVVSPTNFWSADAAYARTNLGLGPTNSPSFANVNVGTDLIISGMSNQVRYSGGGYIDVEECAVGVTTNMMAWGSGTQVEFTVPVNFFFTNHAATTRTNLGIPWSGLTNTNSTNMLSALGTVPISGGGTGTTNSAMARTNLGLGWTNLTNTSAAQFAIDAGLVRTTNTINWASNAMIASVSSNIVTGFVAITNGGTGTNSSGGARTNLGLIWSGLTNTNSTNMLSALGGFPIGSTLYITNGGTGGTNAASARTNLGIGGGYWGVVSFTNFGGYFSNSSTTNSTNVTNAVLNIWISNGIITNVTQ